MWMNIIQSLRASVEQKGREGVNSLFLSLPHSLSLSPWAGTSIFSCPQTSDLLVLRPSDSDWITSLAPRSLASRWQIVRSLSLRNCMSQFLIINLLLYICVRLAVSLKNFDWHISPIQGPPFLGQAVCHRFQASLFILAERDKVQGLTIPSPEPCWGRSHGQWSRSRWPQHDDRATAQRISLFAAHYTGCWALDPGTLRCTIHQVGTSHCPMGLGGAGNLCHLADAPGCMLCSVRLHVLIQ